MATDIGVETQRGERTLHGERQAVISPLLVTIGKDQFVVSPGFKKHQLVQPGQVGVLKRILNVWNSRDSVKRFDPREKERLRFGRNPQSDIPISDPTVSASHAFISAESGEFYIQDGDGNKESRNGTKIEEIKPPTRTKKDVSDKPGYFIDEGRPITIFLGNEKVVYKTNQQGKKLIETSEGKQIFLKTNENGISELMLGRHSLLYLMDIDNPQVSRSHALVALQGNVLKVEDLTSKNGTFVQLDEVGELVINGVTPVNMVQLEQQVTMRDQGKLTRVRQRLIDFFRSIGTRHIPPDSFKAERDLIINPGLLGQKEQSEHQQPRLIDLRKQELPQSFPKEVLPIEMKKFIDEGIELLKNGKFEQAMKHYDNQTKAVVLGHREGFGMGEIQQIKQLLSDNDVLVAIAQVASHSRLSEGGHFEIASIHFNGILSKPEEFPDLYKPEFIQKFYAEVGQLYAEEWLHALQHETKAPVAGIADSETDITAYFYSAGLPLSDGFLKRYPGRKIWYEAQMQRIQAAN